MKKRNKKVFKILKYNKLGKNLEQKWEKKKNDVCWNYQTKVIGKEKKFSRVDKPLYTYQETSHLELSSQTEHNKEKWNELNGGKEKPCSRLTCLAMLLRPTIYYLIRNNAQRGGW